jgi:hypothetical protein
MHTGKIENAPRTLKSSGLGTWRRLLPAIVLLATAAHAFAASSPIRFAGRPSEFVLSEVSERTLRVELSPLDVQGKPSPRAPSPVLVSFSAGEKLRARELSGEKVLHVGNLRVLVKGSPLKITVQREDGKLVQELTFDEGGGKTSTIKVIEPEGGTIGKTSGRLPTVDEVGAALAKLPPEVRAGIKQVVLNPVENPDDAYWRQQPGFDADHVSAMTANARTGTVNVFPVQNSYQPQSMATTFAHEVGHFVHRGNGQRSDFNHPAWDPWKQAIASDKSAASKYAKNNPAEDFAESYALYSMSKGTPAHDAYRKIMPERFKLLDQMYGGA